MNMTAVAPVLVTWMGRVALVLTRTVPKLSELCPRTSVEGLETPTREMNSREVLAVEEISTEAARVVAAEFCGVKAMLRVQLAPGTRVEQLLATV